MTTIIGFLIFLYSIILHEVAHGFVAERLGDPTAKLSGRLTLKIAPHLDVFTSIILPLLLIFSGSPVIFGSAKPVPIDPYNLRNPRKDMGLIGLAGPATNLILAIILSLLARVIIILFPSNFLLSILSHGVQANLVLAIFNLIPIPPLDGGRIAVAFLPGKISNFLASLEPYGFFLILLFLFFPNSLFSLPDFISTTASFLFRLIFPQLPLV